MVHQDSFIEIEKKILEKHYQPVYFLYGEEVFFKEEILSTLKNSFSNTTFTFSSFHADETTLKNILSMISSYPMFSKYNLIVIREFQKIKPSTREIALIENYLKNPLPSTILVLMCDGLTKKDMTKKNFSIFKNFSHSFPKLKSTSEFISLRLHRLEWKITPRALQVFSAYVSNLTQEINNEIQKLILFCGKRKNLTIKEEDVLNVVGVSKEYNIFSLLEELMQKNKRKSSGIIIMMLRHSQRPKETLFSIISFLSSFFSKLLKLQHHSYKQMNNATAAKKLGLYGGQAYFLSDYREYAKLFSAQKIERICQTLAEIDMKLKGIYPYSSETSISLVLINEIIT